MDLLPEIERFAVERETMKRFKEETEFLTLSLNLLIEATSFVIVSYSLSTSDKGWNRNDAIIGGSLVRLHKLIDSILDNTCKDRREIGFILARLAFETSVNILFLLRSEEEVFDSYVSYSLKHELKLKKKIEKNIAHRGESIPIETRMLNSIKSTFEVSGMTQEEIDNKKNWGGKNLFEKSAIVGFEELYLGAFGGASHSVHGNWMDLLEYHLEIKSDGFFDPDPSWSPMRPQILEALTLIVIETVEAYLKNRFPPVYDYYSGHLSDLENRVLTVSDGHEEFLSSC